MNVYLFFANGSVRLNKWPDISNENTGISVVSIIQKCPKKPESETWKISETGTFIFLSAADAWMKELMCRMLLLGLCLAEPQLQDSGSSDWDVFFAGRREKHLPVCIIFYIQESAEDTAFLPGLNARGNASLRFRSAEQSFENDLYLYAASEVLDQAKTAGLTVQQLRELRCCLHEGLARTDYLLHPDIQQTFLNSAKSVHERNYWQAMIRMGRKFC